MGKRSLSNEKKIITFFIFATAIVFVLSVFFLLRSIKVDELGGSFISAMLLFISAYGLIVFIARSVRYSFITKLQKAVLDENITSISELELKFNKSNAQIVKQLNFLINNGYLSSYYVSGDYVLNEQEEAMKLKIARETMYREKIKQEIKEEEAKKVKSSNKKKSQIESSKCPNCGAKVKFEEGSTVCVYCGNVLNKE